MCKDVFTKEMRDQVIGIVMTGFQNKTIPLKDTPANREKLSNPAKLKEYAISTLNNWFLKDPRLNGGVQHKIKNPGSRAGQGDKIVQNYKVFSEVNNVAHEHGIDMIVMGSEVGVQTFPPDQITSFFTACCR